MRCVAVVVVAPFPPDEHFLENLLGFPLGQKSVFLSCLPFFLHFPLMKLTNYEVITEVGGCALLWEVNFFKSRVQEKVLILFVTRGAYSSKYRGARIISHTPSSLNFNVKMHTAPGKLH